MVQPTMGRPLSEMERDIAAELRNSPPTANVGPPSVSAPALEMPHYVEHDEEATEIGKLSAEAVVRVRSCGERDRVDGCRTARTRQAMRSVDPRCARRDRGAEGHRKALPRRGQARLRSHRKLLAGRGAGSHDLYRIEGKDRRSSHHRRTEIKKEVRAELASDGES